MGLKSGSRDAELDDADDGDRADAPSDENAETDRTDERPADDADHATDGTDHTDERPADDADHASDEPVGTGPRTADEATDGSDDPPSDGRDDRRDGPPATTDEPGDETHDRHRADDHTGSTDDGESTAAGTAGVSDDRPSVESLPYVLRRDRVNEGRDQIPFFLRETVIDGERELRESLEERLGEDVYKSDYREAAMVVAQEHPELVAEVLRRWGYDL